MIRDFGPAFERLQPRPKIPFDSPIFLVAVALFHSASLCQLETKSQPLVEAL